MVRAAVVLLLMCCASSVWGAPKPIPTWAQVEKALNEHFRQLGDYRPGDLITREDVAPAFAQLRKLGWTVPGQDQIVGRMLDNGHPLVVSLRSPAGKTFMRKISHQAGIYDRLNLVLKQHRGDELIRDLIKLPKGAEIAVAPTDRDTMNLSQLQLIYQKGMATPSQQKRLTEKAQSEMIYTADAWIAAVKQRYPVAAPRPASR